MPTEEFRLRRENQLLKKMVVDLATIIREVFNELPEDIRTHDNCVRALEISMKLIDTYGPTLSTPNHRQ